MKNKNFLFEFSKVNGEKIYSQISAAYLEDGDKILTNEEYDDIQLKLESQGKRITNLEKGVAADNFVTDDSVAYVKSVPANAAPYAAISKVGGMTHRVNVGTEEAPVYELRHAAVTEVESIGSNLIPFPYATNTVTKNGVTFTVNADGSIMVNGTASARTAITLYSGVGVFRKGMYRFTIAEPSVGVTLGIYATKSGVSSIDTGTTNSRTVEIPEDGMNVRLQLVVNANASVSEGTVYPRANVGETALPYAPYVKNTFPIPEAVQALDGYGWGIDGEYNNHVAYEDDRRTWNYRVVKKVFDGTENWYDSVSMGNARDTNYFRLKIGDLYYGVADLAVSNKYATANITVSNKALGVDIIQSTSSTAAFSGCNIGIRPEDFDTLKTAEFKARLAEWYAAGDPLVVYYVLTAPEVTDISDILPADNLIEVEGGGTITFENEHGLAVPSEVIYQTKGAAV